MSTTCQTRARRRAGLLVPVLVLLIGVAAAHAQGKGGSKGKKAGSGPVTSGSAGALSSGAAAAGGVAIRQFGAWLDDASVLTPGDAWTAITFGRYGSLAGSQTDFPVIDAGFGISKRTQFGLTVPYYRARFHDGTSVGGLGDVFLSGKVLLLEANDDRGFGLAISPVVEFSQDPAPGRGTFGWGAPLSIEGRVADLRVFGTTGYFSRGAVFAAGAFEVPVGDRFVTTGGLTMMRSTNDSLAADAISLSKSRADITASAAYFVSPSIAVFVGTGSTLGNADGTGTTSMLTGGVSISFAPRIAQ
jgi:hypothetical protein